jgi:hypothetical protein
MTSGLASPSPIVAPRVRASGRLLTVGHERCSWDAQSRRDATDRGQARVTRAALQSRDLRRVKPRFVREALLGQTRTEAFSAKVRSKCRPGVHPPILSRLIQYLQSQ